MMDIALNMATLLTNITAVNFNLEPPPTLTGPLAPNECLAGATKLGNMFSPFSLIVAKDKRYVSLGNGLAVKYQKEGNSFQLMQKMATSGNPDCPPALNQNPDQAGGNSMDKCGRPLGIAGFKNRFLIVADPSQGLWWWRPESNTFGWLLRSNTEFGGQPLGFISDVVAQGERFLLFTSTSVKWPYHKWFGSYLEGDTSSRVMGAEVVENQQNRLEIRRLVLGVYNMSFANSLEMHKDGTLLIVEALRSRIFKYDYRANTITPFATNLPGFPALIRRSPRDTYWVAMTFVRSQKYPSLLDAFPEGARRQRMATNLPVNLLAKNIPKYGLAVELDSSGNIIRSIHDPTGKLFTSLSQVTENDGVLYIVSPTSNFIASLKLSDLPACIGSPAQADTSYPAMDSTVERFLEQVEKRTRTMAPEEMSEATILLTERLLECRMDTSRAVERSNFLINSINNPQTPA